MGPYTGQPFTAAIVIQREPRSLRLTVTAKF
jgi:hypothetical protein